MQLSLVIRRNDSVTGTQGISPPRKFSSHMMSQRDAITCWVAPAFFMASRTLDSLLSVLSPLQRSSRIHTFSSGICGRSVQISPTRSFSVSMDPPFSTAIFRNSSALTAPKVLPSNPTRPPARSSSFTYSATVGTPGSPMRNSRMPVPFNCSSACRKYLPSVHSPASSMVITAVPADPVNPVI